MLLKVFQRGKQFYEVFLNKNDVNVLSAKRARQDFKILFNFFGRVLRIFVKREV